MLLDEIGWNVVTMRDRRYDMIIHLVTSAKGAKDYFNLPENKEKFQAGMETAQIIDTNTINAWIGHPNFHIIDNHNKTLAWKKSKCVEMIL